MGDELVSKRLLAHHALRAVNRPNFFSSSCRLTFAPG